MSGFASRIVALAADQLPEPERSRRREEWDADLEGATEQGLSRVGIALGAVALAVRSPLPSPAAAGWWAQWALAISAIGSVVWVSLHTSGLFLSDPVIRHSIEPIVGVLTIASLILVVLAGLRTRGFPWVASGTGIMTCLTAALWIVGVSWFPVLAVMLGLAVAALAVIGWRLRRGERRHSLAVLSLIAIPLVVVAVRAAGPFGDWVPVVAALTILAVTLVAAGRSPRSADGVRTLGLASVVVMSAAILVTTAAVAYGVTVATDPASGVRMSKLWTRLAPAVLAEIGVIAAAVGALLVLSIVLVLVARRRRAWRGVEGSLFLVAGALASVGSNVPYLGPWDIVTSHTVALIIGLAGCLATVVGIVFLVAPARVRSPEVAVA